MLLACALTPRAASAQLDLRPHFDDAPAKLVEGLELALQRGARYLDPEPESRVTVRDGSVVGVFTRTQHGPFDNSILAAAQRWKLDPFLLKGLLANESKLDPVRYGKRRYAKRKGELVVVAGGAVGIAQFTGSGIRAVNLLRRRRQRDGRRVLLFDSDLAQVPTQAIFAAAELLAHLLKSYGRDGGITAYNSGVVGGLAVYRYGFWRARSAGKLSRVGIYEIQGYRFLLNVLRRANWYRSQAGLPQLEQPDADRPDSRRFVHAPITSPVS